jgi:predicted permease
MDVVTDIWRDLKLAVRSLAKARAFTFVVVISLGIGMTPVIAVPYGMRVITKDPPGVNTEGLVEVFTMPQGSRSATSLWSFPDLLDLQNANTGASLAGWASASAEVILDPSQGGKQVFEGMHVTANYFAVVGVALAQGPGFPGVNDTTDPVVIVRHDFWQRRLGADPGLVGKSITVNKVPHTVVGITPERFGGHLGGGIQGYDVFLPLDRHPRILADTTVRFDRAKEWVRIHGRLSPGAGIAQARDVVAAVTAQLAKEHPDTNESKSGTVEPYHPIGNVDAESLTLIRTLLQTLTILPLLVICLNITGMVQVRSAMRERELSIRQAIGATRKRLMQTLLAESVVLAAVGATLASVMLFNIPPLMAWWAGEPLPPALADALRVDLPMIAIVTGMCLVTSIVFGGLPAARFSRPVIITVLKDDAGTGGIRAGRLQRVATALQVAIATPLLIFSAMTLDRMRATATDHLGFDSEVLYAAPLPVDAGGFNIRSAPQTLEQAAGVESVTVADGLPLDFRYRMTRVATVPEDKSAPKIVATHVTRVGDRYLETLGVPLIRGRRFSADDGPGAEDVTIVSKPLAERLFPEQDPLGRRLTFDAGSKTERTLTIIGVTAEFPTSQMSTERSQLLLPLAQHANVEKDSVNVEDDRGGGAKLMLVARSAPGAQEKAMAAALENVLRPLDDEFEPASVVTGVWLRKNSMNDFLTQSAVGGVVGGVLLLLAALGIYGVVGLMVATRIREIAVRVALGASRRRVMGMVLFDVVKLVLPGVFIGFLFAFAFIRLKGDDWGIALSKLEPLGYLAGCVVALLIALVASLAPARRAASVQPMVAMRSE